jgi:hypothetical protein
MAIDYRSKQVWGQLPVVHIAVGGRQADGRYRLGRARGIIALGDVAIGLVAVGGVAIGLLSVGGVALGLVAVGAMAVGMAAVGAVSIGLVAVGAVAIGLMAVGVATAGLIVGPSPAAARWLGGTCQVEDEAQPRSKAGSEQPIQTEPHG